MDFVKMNGAGNDYIFVYAPLIKEKIKNWNAIAKRLSDRHFGIGGDGLVLVDRDKDRLNGKEDNLFVMRIFNADGSEAEICGNALRCVGKLVYEKGYTRSDELTVRTKAGCRKLSLDVVCGKVESVTVDMGCPKPYIYDSFAPVPVNLYGGGTERATLVDVGNPHAVAFVKEIDENALSLAERISKSADFKDGINSEVIEVVAANRIRMAVYERGSGETLACGSGATAAVAAGINRGFLTERVTVSLKGGQLTIENKRGTYYMSGGAEINYEGSINL